jgi:hypothetical protein
MHEKNLYQVSNPDDPVFVEMVELVKSQAGVPNTRNWEQKVHDKCRDLINTSTRTWKRDGLLVARNNVTWKTGVFQYLWDCAIQAAHVSIVAAQSIERTLPRGEPSNSASSVNLDSMTGSGWRPDDNQSRKVLIYLPLNMRSCLFVFNREVLEACNNLGCPLLLNEHVWRNRMHERMRGILLKSTAKFSM